jgi:hypothetical protein
MDERVGIEVRIAKGSTKSSGMPLMVPSSTLNKPVKKFGTEGEFIDVRHLSRLYRPARGEDRRCLHPG